MADIAHDPDLDDEGCFKDDVGAMTLASGNRVNPLRLAAADIHIGDIAHALSRQCRYNGHVTGYLSVARHSVWVAERLIDTDHVDLALDGLLHDAAEAYLGDMIRPLKRGALGGGYLEAEKRVEAVIAEHFGTHYPMPDEVSGADTWVLLNRELNDARWTWFSTPDEDLVAFVDTFDLLARNATAPLHPEQRSH